MYTGPNIINDGLVFGYDTAYGVADNDTATRFYQGKPTTNLAPSSLADWGIESGAVKTATGNYYNGQPTYNCRAKVGESWVGIYKTISNLRTTAGSSGTVTLSCFVKNTNSSSYPLYAHIGHDFSSTKTIAANSDWQRVQWTVNQSSMSSDYVELRPYTNSTNVYLEMTMPQVEVNISTATPWLNGSRSSTDALKDLKKLININLNNASFDSAGQPITDGTDDQIVVSGADNLNFGVGSRFTIETVVKLLAMPTSGNTSAICCKQTCVGIDWYYPSATGIKFRYGIRNSTNGQQTSESSVVDLNKWYHVVFTYEPKSSTGMKLYVNAVHQSSRSNLGFSEFANSSKDFYIGGSAALGGGPNRGSIHSAVVRMYNKPLSASEVTHNYKTYKNRFNI